MEQATEVLLLKMLLPAAMVVFLIALAVVFLNQHFRQNVFKQMLEKEALKSEYQIGLLRANLEAQEAERKRIALDLHDEIGALLATSKIYVSQLNDEQSKEDKTTLHHKLNELYDMITTNIRSISHDLRPVVLERFGFEAAIEALSDRLEASGIEFNYIHQKGISFSKTVEIHIYRIIQELVSNSLKHANANQISLTIHKNGDSIAINYIDNGVGFQNNKLHNGLGMIGIESRVELLKGTFKKLNVQMGVHFLITIPT